MQTLVSTAGLNSSGIFTLTDNQNWGDISVKATGDDAAAWTTLAGGTAAAPVADTTAGDVTAISQFSNAPVKDLNTVQGSTTKVSPGATFGSSGTTGELVVSAGTNKYVFTATANETVTQLINNINNSGDNLNASINSAAGAFDLTDTSGNGNISSRHRRSDATVTQCVLV